MTVDQEKIERIAEKEFQEIVREINEGYGCLGAWIICLWYPYEGVESNEERKEIFLLLLKKLIDAGLVKVFRPDHDFSELFNPTKPMEEQEHMFWSAPSDEIVRWYRRNWPADADSHDPHDLKINDFFYDLYHCPPIVWKDPQTGMWLGS